MLKIIVKVIKKVIFAIFMLYGLNLITTTINVVIPINIISIGVVSILGIPGMCLLIGLVLVV